MSGHAWEDSLSDTDPELFAVLQRAAEIESCPLLFPRMVVGGKYRIEAELGRGGMGAVYRATHIISRKQVALKCMLRSKHDGVSRARFLREARAAARIDHPNVVNVYDVGEEDDYCFLVMELLHGCTLNVRFANMPLAVAEALELLIPVMRGVAAIHRAGVIHRDLKPDNIFVCQGPDGALREAKILDFGISALSDDPEDQTITREGMILGTPLYMSPEQLQSASNLDERSDIYSLGVILYQALTGKPPFENKHTPKLVLDVVHASPKPVRQLRPEVPVGIARVVMRALEKRPKDRYGSIDSMIEALTSAHAEPQRLQSRGTLRAAIVSLMCVSLGAAAWLVGPRELPELGAGVVVTPLVLTADVYSSQAIVKPGADSVEPESVLLASEPVPETKPPPVPIRDDSLTANDSSAHTQSDRSSPQDTRAQEAKRKRQRDCAMPYSIDASGRKKYKTECLL